MFQRMAAGMLLAKQSAKVLLSDKELIIFPILSSISCILVMLTFAVPLFLTGGYEALESKEGLTQAQQILGYVVAFLYYFVNFFVIVFFNSALVSCAIIRLKGGDPTLSDGFSSALARLPQIIAWALVAATVGLLLKMLESRSGRGGNFIASLLGMAWSITTFFVVPVLVVERLGPFAAIKRSGSIIRSTWGESLTARVGIGLLSFLAFVPFIGAIIGGVALLAQSAAAGITLIVIGAMGVAIVGLLSSAISTILLGGMYIYATEGQVPSQFDSEAIQTAFARKRTR
ncbi:MAG: DUF6159 family protein [Pirellulaceae bacterium]|nr:DUF6159 family protein [Pirellulaceae bacterium]